MVPLRRWNRWWRGLLVVCILVAWVSFTWWLSVDPREFVWRIVFGVALSGVLWLHARFSESKPTRPARDEKAAILRCCWGLTTDRDAAIDVAVEAVARAKRHWGLEGTRPLPWILSSALSLVRSDWQTSRPTTAESTSAEQAASPASRDVAAALRRLPAHQREAVALHYLGGESIENSAAAMELAVPMVSSLLARGSALLAELLFEEATEVPVTELQARLREAADRAMTGVDLTPRRVGSRTP